MKHDLSILAIEDSSADFRLIERHLRLAGLRAQCTRIDTLDELYQSLDAGGWDIILYDYNVPQLNFENDLALIHQRLPDTPVILVSGSIQGASTLCSLINQRTIEHDNRHSNLLSSVYFVGLAHRIHSA
jgi:DNA-binding NtrC family response regulator